MTRSTVPGYLASAAALTLAAVAPVTGRPKPGAPGGIRPPASGPPGAPEPEPEPEAPAMAEAPTAMAASAATPAAAFRIECDMRDLSTRLTPQTLQPAAGPEVGRR